MDKDRIRELLVSMERVAGTAQETARNYMDREPTLRSQNNSWRYLLQDLRELKKLILEEE